MPRTSRRIAAVRFPGIHRVMEEMRALAASGADVISLAQAVPDLSPPSPLIERAAAALRRPDTHLYTPDPGLPALREGIAAMLSREHGVPADPDGVLVTPGANAAYAALLPALAEPGDEIILPSPVYLNHLMAVQLAGCVPVEVPCIEAEGYEPDLDALAAAVTPRTAAITVVTPNNPTGAVYSRATLEGIARLAAERDLWIIADEVYAPLAFADRPHLSIGSLAAARGRTVTIGSFSKSHAMTGWRCGWLAAPPELAREVLKVHDTFFICAPRISQEMALEALRVGTSFLAPYRRELLSRRRALASVVASLPGLHWVEPRGALFAFVRYDHPISSSELALRILREARVCTVPGDAFGNAGEGHLRMSFGASDVPRLQEAGRRLSAFFTSLFPAE